MSKIIVYAPGGQTQKKEKKKKNHKNHSKENRIKAK